MGQGIFERIQARIELFRLERRYTRHRDRRSTFVSNAIYVDGEYIYQTPNATGSSTASESSSHHNTTMPAYDSYSPTTTTTVASMNSKDRKKMNRFSSIPAFRSTSSQAQPSAQDWRMHRASFDGSR